MPSPNNKYKSKRARLEEYYKNPNVQAYLAGIRFTETGGTGLNWNAKNPKSTARGPYQFLDSSQKDILNNWGVNAYSKDPKEVHLAALGLMAYKPQGLESIKKGDFKKADTMYNKYWTSLPGGAEPNVHTPKLGDVRSKELSRLTKPVAPKPVPAPEPGYFEKFMTGYNAPFNDPKTDYNFPTRFIGGLQEVFGVDTTQPVQKQKHGGRLTKKGKKRRKYGPRPDYMNQNPNGMTTGPITQRSIGNTPGGGYMAFADGGNTAYESWYRYNTPEGREGLPDSYSNYDYQRYYNDAVRGLNPMGFDEGSQHFPDTYKYPWHPSFSDESIYYTNQKETPALSYNTKADFKEYTRSKKAEGGFTTQERQDKGLYVHQGETPYDLVYNQDGTYSSVPMGMAPHYSGQTNVPTSPCGPGFAIDYDENGREVCVPVGLGQPASPTSPAPKPSYGGYSGYTPYVPVLPRRTMQEDYADPGFAMNLTRRDLRQLARRSREAQEQFEPLKKSEAEVSSTKAPKGQRVNMGPSFFQRLGRSIGSIFRKCLPGEDCYKFEHGGWVYPTNTAYPVYANGGGVEEPMYQKDVEMSALKYKSDPYEISRGGFDIVGYPGLEVGLGKRFGKSYLNPYGEIAGGAFYNMPQTEGNAGFIGGSARVGIDPVFERKVTEYRGKPSFVYEQNSEPFKKIKRKDYWSFNPNLTAGATYSTNLGVTGDEFKSQVTPFISPGMKVAYNYPGDDGNKYIGLYGRGSYSPGNAPQYNVGIEGGGDILPINTKFNVFAGVRPDYDLTSGALKMSPTFGGSAKYFFNGGEQPATRKSIYHKRSKRSEGGWTGYPDHTMKSSARQQFDDVRRLTKYDDGGDVSQAQQEYIRNIGRNAATGSVTPLYGAKDPIFTIISGAAGRVIPRMLSLIPSPTKPAATKSEQLPEIPRNRAVPPPHKGLELSPELEPYMSSTRRPATREEQVFESFLSPKRRAELDEERTTYYDSKGNIIPRPKKAKGGPVWEIIEDRPMARKGLVVPPAGMFDTGVQRSDATNTAAQQAVANKLQVEELQGDINAVDAGKVSEQDFRNKYGTSSHRMKYDTRPQYKAQVDQTSKEVAKTAGTIDYPITDIRSQYYKGNPNLNYMVPEGLTGPARAEYEQSQMDVVGMALPFPGLETVGKFPSVFTLGSKALEKVSPVINAVKQTPEFLRDFYNPQRLLDKAYEVDNIIYPKINSLELLRRKLRDRELTLYGKYQNFTRSSKPEHLLKETQLDRAINNRRAQKDAEKSLLEKVTERTPTSISYSMDAPLRKATSYGEGQIYNLKTGQLNTVSVKPGGRDLRIFSDQSKNELLPYTSPQVDPVLTSTLKDNISWVEDNFGGKVFGSSKGVADVGLPHTPKDMEVLISKKNYNKNVGKKYPLISSGDDINRNTHSLGEGKGEVDFVVIDSDIRGNAKGRVAEELFRQFDPDGYYKATRQSLKTGNPLTVPYSPDKLIEMVDPKVKTVMDAMEIDGTMFNKSKHINRIDAYLAYGDPDVVLQAQEKFVKSLVGSKGTLAHKFDLSEFADPSRNLRILDKIGFGGDVDAIVKDPKKMQAVLNDHYLNTTVLSRGVSGHNSNLNRKLSLKEIESAFKEWKPEAGGGMGMGAGQNHVTLGKSGDYEYYGHKQIGLDLPTDNVEKYLDALESKTSGIKKFSEEEAAQVKELLKKYDLRNPERLDSNSITNGKDFIYYVSNNLKLEDMKSALEEFSNITGKKITITEMYGNSNYVSTLKDFDEVYDALQYYFGSKVPSPTGKIRRIQNLEEKLDPLTFLNKDLNLGRSNFDIVKMMNSKLETAISKVDERLNRLESLKKSLESQVDKRFKQIDKNIETLFRKKYKGEYEAFDKLDKEVKELTNLRQALGSRYRKMKNLQQNLKDYGILTVGAATAAGGIGFIVNEANKVNKTNESRSESIKQTNIKRAKEKGLTLEEYEKFLETRRDSLRQSKSRFWQIIEEKITK